MGANEQGVDPAAVAGRWQVVPRTLCFVTYGDDILLMKRSMHKRVFPGHYNGVGGHIERDEDPLTGAVREIREETGLKVTNLRYCGSSHIDAGQQTGILLFVFTAIATSREVIASDEGSLHWMALKEVLDGDLLLVEDLPILLHRIFVEGNIPFFAHVSYDEKDQLLFRTAEEGNEA